ncbi:hypothetical protein A5679_13430 [Mycobacterium scrofulaceum]|uniref:Carrier domain-containing protein n=1 Tax=Mycobacterium scrofulaceum TaxID=1783 RepID=A0A1A2VW72_MYCSC|nr:hypothetical protein A5679_13430 [Mycobacterium scrofulaceum]
MCHEVVTIRKTGPLDVEALRRALTEVVARHEAWRTTFTTVYGSPHQFVREPAEVELPLTDLSELSREDALRRATEIVAADTQRRYDLANGPLVRPRLVRIAEDDHRLYLDLHPLICDGSTLRRVIFPELAALYRSHVIGTRSPLPEPQAQYAEYTTWELDWVHKPEMAERIDRWRRRLAGSAPTQLPLDHPRPKCPSFAGGTIPLTIEPATVASLRQAALAAGGTLLDALVAAFAWWLHLYVDSTDVVFGSQVDLRRPDELPEVAGCCVTAVALRCDVSSEESFTAMVGRIRSVVSEAASDAVPLDTLLDGLGLSRDPRTNPLFQTALLLQPGLTAVADDWSLHEEAGIRDAVGSAKFDLSIKLDERPEGHVVGGLVFSTDLFNRETAREMALHWLRLLNAVAAAPEILMAEHDLVSSEDRRRLLDWYRTTPDDAASSDCAHELISQQARRTPDAVAVQVGSAALTYRQLDDRAAAIASRLVQARARPGTVVAVLLDRTPDLIAAILGILKCGAAFLPLDPRQPDARKIFCINDVGANFVLTDQQLPTGEEPVTATVIDISDLVPHAIPRAFLQNTASSTDLAYVICTSGSTGRPKPVLIEHRSLTNLMRTWSREVGVDASDTVLSVAAISFDLALGDVFCALACGARLVLATTAQATDPAALSALITDSGATYMCATPTTWGALVATGWAGGRDLTVVTGGEALNHGLAQTLLQRCKSVWNAYGPTEATVWTSVERLVAGDTITVGRPLPNARIYITDARGRLQPIGVPGEVVIGGVAVGRGYLNRPDEHARRFGDDPFGVGGRVYRTGDRGRFLPDGRLQHLGRYDDQVKIHGYRVEPGEVESTLCEHPDVGCCAVVAREAGNGIQRLVAYIVGDEDRPDDAAAREWLRSRLPEYMVPSAFVHLRALPTTPSGKLDKAALPAPHVTARTDGQAPRDQTEKRLAELWSELLGLQVADVHSDFFDLGGHSMLAARLLSEVDRAFGVTLSPATFVDAGRTVAKLAELLNAESPDTVDKVACSPPLHFIFADVASAMSLRHFTTLWGAAQPVHALIPDQPDGRFDLSVTIEDHAAQLLSRIRERQPHGPLALVGYSIGGVVAYEIARQAVDAGEQVEWLGVLDMAAPSMTELQHAQMTLRWRLRRVRRLPLRERWVKYAEVALRALRRDGLLQQNDFDYRGATEVVCRYARPGHAVPTHLFVGEVSAADAGDDLLGWNEYHAGPLTLDRLHGDHVTVLELPEVEQLAQTMLKALRAARESNRAEQLVTAFGGRHRKRPRRSTMRATVSPDTTERVVVPFSARARR